MTESSGDAARDRMQPPSFWHDLGAKFQGLPDSVWAKRDAPDRLHMSDGKVCGGDESLRSRFKDIAGRGGMALCAERGLSADCLDGLWVWEDAVMAYLKEEKNPWYREVRSTRWKPGPAKKQELALSAIRPRHDEPHYTLDEALRFNAWVERIQREGMNELLVVTADDQRYVVIDDEHEDLKYWACARAGVTSLTCDVRSASNPGARENVWVVEIDRISVASADLCRRLETEAFGRQIAPPVERPVTPPDGSTTLTPVTTPPLGASALMTFWPAATVSTQVQKSSLGQISGRSPTIRLAGSFNTGRKKMRGQRSTTTRISRTFLRGPTTTSPRP